MIGGAAKYLDTLNLIFTKKKFYFPEGFLLLYMKIQETSLILHEQLLEF